ncbi:MAG: beta-Ala-His dipeptidase [Promethearchaeota archaeon]
MEIKNNTLGKPELFWKYFLEISKIPRCSGNEDKIREFIKQEAINCNFDYEIDNAGNLVINIYSMCSDNITSKTVVLQSHLDMVCEKNTNVIHDFSRDPLPLKIIEQDGEQWLTADGTTLGADNGVGIAFSLTIMKKIFSGDLDISPLSLSLLFTVDEELGLVGAFNIDKNLIKGDYLINLDSEMDTKFIIGCAGGINTSGKFKYQGMPIQEHLSKNHLPFSLNITGLLGGHSGGDINKERINSLKLISEILNKMEPFDFKLVSIEGGNLANAIPREAKAIILLKRDDIESFKHSFHTLVIETESKLKAIEPSLEISIIESEIDNIVKEKIIPDEIKGKIINLLRDIPHGALSSLPDNKDMVHTSTNLASISTKEGHIEIVTSQRSLSEKDKMVIHQKVSSIMNASGLPFKVKKYGDYPGWEPNHDSELLSIARQTYKKLFNQDVIVKIVHAGLECGIFKKRFPKIEMLSLGPSINGAHSPEERLKLKSVEKIWLLILALLEELRKIQ